MLNFKTDNIQMLFTSGGRTNTGFFHFEYNEVRELELSTLPSVRQTGKYLFHILCVFKAPYSLQSDLSVRYLGHQALN